MSAGREDRRARGGWRFGAVCAVALIGLSINAVIAYRSHRRLVESSRWLDHSRQVLAVLSALHGTLREAEAAQRTYLLTGDPGRLDAYRRAAETGGRIETSLARLLDTSPELKARLPALERALRRRFALLQRGIAAYESGGVEAARQSLREHSGQDLTEARDRMIALWRREDELLRARLIEHVRSVNRAEAGFWIASAVAAGLVLASYAAYRRDVDRRARDARALQAALDRAEEGHRARDTLLAVVGHELRTPLTPALLTTVELSERADLDAGARSALEAVVRHLRVEARLIDDLLDTMRLHQGKMPFRFRPVDAHELIGRAIVVCGPELRGGHVRLDRHLEATNAWVRADPARLEQAVLHLLRNAVKFTPAGGTVTITTRNEGPSLRIEVRDTGVGIEPDVLPRIFEAFDRGEGAAARRYGGLGLGLAIARAIAEAHRGRLLAESDGLGRGARFLLELSSLADHPAPAPEAPPTPPRPDRPSRLLFVEDDPGTRHACSRLLRQRGYDVRVASSLAEARRLAAESPEFDALVSDVGLPDGTGWDLMRHLRADGPLPGIALSGYGTPEDEQRSLQSGFAAHLVKPVDIDVLDAAIRRLLDGTNGRPAPPPTP